MNKRNPALDCYIEAMRVCNALRQFRMDQSISLSMWNRVIAKTVQDLLLEQKYVKIVEGTVYLTYGGLMVLESTLAGD